MAKKRTKSNKTEKKNNDITGIILISMGIFVLFSVFSPSASGIVGSFIKKSTYSCIRFRIFSISNTNNIHRMLLYRKEE